MSDKQLKILVTVDEAQLRRSTTLLQRVFGDVKKGIEEVNKAQSGLGAGTGSGVGGGVLFGRAGATPQNTVAATPALGGVGQKMTQALTQQANILRTISSGSKDVLKTMSEDLRRNIAIQKIELESMGKTVDGLQKKYVSLRESSQRLAQAPGGSTLAAQLGLSANDALHDSFNVGAARDEKAALVSTLEKNLQQLTAAVSGSPPGQPPGPGKGGGGKDDPEPRQKMAPGDIMLMAGAIGKAVGGSVSAVGGFIQGQKLVGENNLANIQQNTSGRFLSRLAQGDVRDFHTMRMRSFNDPKRTMGQMLDEDYGGTKAINAQILGSGLEGASNVAMGVGTLVGPGRLAKAAGVARNSPYVRTAGDMANAGSGITGGLIGMGTAYSNFTKGAAEAGEAGTMMSALDAHQAANPATTMAFDLLAQEKFIRASSSRKLQGQHLSARGLGAGYGYSFGESTGLAENLQRLTGMDGMFGSKGKLIKKGVDLSDNQAHRILEDASKGVYGVGGVIGSGPDGGLRERLMNMRKDQYAKGGRGLLESSMQMAGHGFDMNTSQRALANVFEAGGGSKGLGAEKTMQAFERAVERGTQKGFTDPRVQEELVSAMGTAAQGTILKNTEGLEVLSQFLTGGSNGKMTVAGAEARRGVMGAMDSMSANNPFFQGVNVATAKNLLGPGGTPRQLMGLSGASDSELLVGGQRFDDLGVDKATRLKAFQERISSKVTAYANTDPELKRQLEENGGDVSKLDPKLLRSTLRNMKSFGSDQAANAATEMFQNLAGLGDLSKADPRRLKQNADGLAVAAISTEERTKMEILGKEVAKAMQETFAKVDPVKIAKEQKKVEEEGKNFDFSQGKMFVVQIVKSIDSPANVPSNGRERP